MVTEIGFSASTFQDSSDGQDKAISTKASVTMLDIVDYAGFQHPLYEPESHLPTMLV